MKALIILILAFAFAGSQAFACSGSDVEIKGVRSGGPMGYESKTIWIVGEIVNNCDQPVGAQIRLMVITADGAPWNDVIFWPKRVYNIPARDTFAFSYYMLAPPPGSKFEASLVSIRDWKP
jgi:hypothetical protein